MSQRFSNKSCGGKICYAMKGHVCQLIVINYYIQIINPINIYKGTQHFYVSMVVKNFVFYKYLFYTRNIYILQVSVHRLPNVSPI